MAFYFVRQHTKPLQLTRNDDKVILYLNFVRKYNFTVHLDAKYRKAHICITIELWSKSSPLFANKLIKCQHLILINCDSMLETCFQKTKRRTRKYSIWITTIIISKLPYKCASARSRDTAHVMQRNKTKIIFKLNAGERRSRLIKLAD